MKHETTNPTTLAAGRVRNSISLAAIDLDHNQNRPALQALRADFVSRRLRITPVLADVVAGLAFGEVTR